jgi:methylmalonyl-CoA carboxyltransferase large subunit
MANEFTAELEELRLEVARLGKLVEQSNEFLRGEDPSEDVLLVIAAACAAFLGKRAKIRSIRPIVTAADAWRVQGRLSIQGSHHPR